MTRTTRKQASRRAAVDAVGIAWYRREDYDRLRGQFVDGDKLHETFDAWHESAGRVLDNLRSQGLTVELVLIEPDAFAAWCQARGRQPDGPARSEYASLQVARKHRDRG